MTPTTPTTIKYRAAVLHGVRAPMTVENSGRRPARAGRCAGADQGRRPLPYRSRSHYGVAALSLADRARARGGGGRRAGRPRRAGPQASATMSCCRGIRIAVIASTATAICRSCAKPISRTGRRRSPSMAPAARALADGRELKQLMFLGAFAEYAVVADHQAIVVPRELPFDRACLIGCGVMTGVGAALNIATVGYGDTVMVIGCGAVGLSAVQGARLAGAGEIIAVDLDTAKLALAERVGATSIVDARGEDPAAIARERRPDAARMWSSRPPANRPRFASVSRQCARRRSHLARQDRCRRGCGVPLGQPDEDKRIRRVELWRGTAGARFSAPRPRLSRRKAQARRI